MCLCKSHLKLKPFLKQTCTEQQDLLKETNGAFDRLSLSPNRHLPFTSQTQNHTAHAVHQVVIKSTIVIVSTIRKSENESFMLYTHFDVINRLQVPSVKVQMVHSQEPVHINQRL